MEENRQGPGNAFPMKLSAVFQPWNLASFLLLNSETRMANVREVNHELERHLAETGQ